MRPPVPIEDIEQIQFVEYLDLKRLKYTAIPNSTFTRSWKVKNRNKAMGLHGGLPDILVIVKRWLVFIEMKRQRGGVVSDKQREWIKAINETENGKAYVAKGSEEAIKIIETLLCSS